MPKRAKKEDKPGELRFYCQECFGATEAIQKAPASSLKCARHQHRDVVVRREMIPPRGFPYYVSIEKKRRG